MMSKDTTFAIHTKKPTKKDYQNVVHTAVVLTKSPSLDKLAQGVIFKPQKELYKRAKSKWWTQKIVSPLVYHAKKLGDEKMRKYYQRALFCSHQITQTDKRLKTQYCNTRVCLICNKIRTAKLINGYVQQLFYKIKPESDTKLSFVTLTLPNVRQENLTSTIVSITKTLSKILASLRKTKGLKVNGIRSLECTITTKKHLIKRGDVFHPHIHMIVDNGAEEIVSYWLKHNPTASYKAQKIVHVKNGDLGVLQELFKYATKIIGHEKPVIDEDTGEIKNVITLKIPELHQIIVALSGRRRIHAFGDIRQQNEDVYDKLKGQEYDIAPQELMEWQWKTQDWHNIFDDPLTNYIAPDYIEFKEISNTS
jgi:hypothetical protein